jgi:hypothetical protein
VSFFADDVGAQSHAGATIRARPCFRALEQEAADPGAAMQFIDDQSADLRVGVAFH